VVSKRRANERETRRNRKEKKRTTVDYTSFDIQLDRKRDEEIKKKVLHSF